MICIRSEQLLTIRQAQQAIPGNPSIPTLWRWMLKGVQGCVLESVKVGGRRFTSREACERFIETRPAHEPSPERRSVRQQRVEFNRAKAILDHYGV